MTRRAERARSNVPAVPPLVQRNGASYEWAGARAWACYRPDADVLLPMFYKYDAADVVPPLAGPRNISALLRFGCKKGDGKNLVEHYGHRLRQELLASWAADPLEGSVAGLTSKEVRAGWRPARRSVAPVTNRRRSAL